MEIFEQDFIAPAQLGNMGRDHGPQLTRFQSLRDFPPLPSCMVWGVNDGDAFGKVAEQVLWQCRNRRQGKMVFVCQLFAAYSPLRFRNWSNSSKAYARRC
ncbi:hypothetical protein [Roseinatronobacter alkalisoli]|uniref:hypothetical protein n=1 Tax=Roseinatronobacter alkalisoli TaxID=3028235 RepID=UPI0030824869